MTIRTLLIHGAVVSALLASATQATAATQSVSASATVVAPITLSQITPFNFGSIVPGATAGTVVLSTSNGRTVTGGTALGNGSTPTAAVVRVTGSGSSTYAASFSSGTTLSDGLLHSMTVGTYVMKTSGGSDQTSGFTGTLVSGTQDFSLGATLAVDTATNNPAGTYSTANAGGTPLTVTVNYN